MLLQSTTAIVLMSHITRNQNGVIGTMTAQHVVSGWLMAGMKNGASGKMTGVGNTMEHGK